MLWGFWCLSCLLKSSLLYVAFFKYFTPLHFLIGDEEIKTLYPEFVFPVTTQYFKTMTKLNYKPAQNQDKSAGISVISKYHQPPKLNVFNL